MKFSAGGADDEKSASNGGVESASIGGASGVDTMGAGPSASIGGASGVDDNDDDDTRIGVDDDVDDGDDEAVARIDAVTASAAAPKTSKTASAALSAAGSLMGGGGGGAVVSGRHLPEASTDPNSVAIQSAAASSNVASSKSN